jgi:hypothetical protein
MKKILLMAAAMMFSGCWLMKTYYTSQGIEVKDQAKVGLYKVEMAVMRTLDELKVSKEYVRGTKIHVVNVPICVQEDGGFIVADGLTLQSAMGPLVLVSTLNGCFDSISHEIGHVIRGDPEHEDVVFWNKVAKAEQWVREEYCADTYKPITPEQAAKMCGSKK